MLPDSRAGKIVIFCCIFENVTKYQNFELIETQKRMNMYCIKERIYL